MLASIHATSCQNHSEKRFGETAHDCLLLQISGLGRRKRTIMFLNKRGTKYASHVSLEQSRE